MREYIPGSNLKVEGLNDNDGKVDYSNYTYPELLQALNSIDARSYPKNYENIERAIEQISPAMRAAYNVEPEDLDEGETWDAPEPKPKDPEAEYKKHVITALIIAMVSGYMLWAERIPLPIDEGMIFTFRGMGETLAKGAFLLAISVLGSFAINLADHREDKKIYRTYALIAESVATVLLGATILVSAQ